MVLDLDEARRRHRVQLAARVLHLRERRHELVELATDALLPLAHGAELIDARCTFRAEEAVTINAVDFDTERNFDYLTIAGRTYTGRRGPSNILLTLGATFTWRSDRTVQR